MENCRRNWKGVGWILLFFPWISMAATLSPLTWEERVRAQEAIERVYYEHRIWPKENPGPKPPFDQMISRAQIEAKVEDTLKKSVALQKFWQRPILPEQLQAEMDRMARQTKDPETLEELFAALDNDPYLIAECLARPALADRLIHNWYAYDTRFHKETREKAEKALKELTPEDFATYPEGTYSRVKYALETAKNGNANHPLLERQEGRRIVSMDEDQFRKIKARLPLDDTSLSFRETGEAFIVERTLCFDEASAELDVLSFSKQDFGSWWFRQALSLMEHGSERAELGFNYSLPALSAEVEASSEGYWVHSLLDLVPEPLRRHTAVWTGTEMIIWGGSVPNAVINTGGRYNPSTDSWSATSIGPNCPSTREGHTAIWTGEEMIIWGGSAKGGGRYNPSLDRWTAVAEDGTPRYGSVTVWTGEEMLVWGSAGDGGRYSPTRQDDGNSGTATWESMSATGAPISPRAYMTAVWTGTEMIVWGGIVGGVYQNTGGRYNPITDSWQATSIGTNCPSSRENHTAIWASDEMIIWGGKTDFTNMLNTGGRYNPTADQWMPISAGDGCPIERWRHTAIWTGMEMIVWGGLHFDGVQTAYAEDSGGKYNPTTDSWRATSRDVYCPSSRSGHTAVWTGMEMIIWGGADDSSGGRYNPSTDSWVPTSTGNRPSGRSGNTSVWTGSEMVVWGGRGNDYEYFNTGGRYSPSTDSWVATSIEAGCPSARTGHTSVWTGTEMIIWGGYRYDNNLRHEAENSGGRYDPILDSWISTSTQNYCPLARSSPTAVWTGSEMIIWGGWNIQDTTDYGYLNTGGRYSPSSDSWTPTFVNENCPSARTNHTAVWTGSEMIIWGGGQTWAEVNSGGRYNPTTDTWITTSTGENCPEPRTQQTAVWTGSEMIVWGGGWMPSMMLFEDFNSGGKYNPETDSWTSTSMENSCPSARENHSAVWTGTKMIIWGGYSNTGGLYSPSSDSWVPTPTDPPCPLSRAGHAAVWTGTQMIIWGGHSGLGTIFASGGIYRPYSSHERPVEKP